MTRRTISFIAIVSFAVLAWVLWPRGQSFEPASTEQVSTLGSHAEAAELADHDGAVAQGDAAAEREEVEASALGIGHRVLVLDVDGSPLPGIQVWLREIRADLVDDLLSYWAANPEKLRPWDLPGQGVFAWTDDSGVAQFELRGAASAAVVLREAMSATSFPSIPEGGSAEPNTIQLVATPSIEVLVRDASDRPVEGKEVKLRLSSAQDLVGLEGEARLMRRSQGGPWREPNIRVVSDAEGRAMLPIFLDETERESLGQAEHWTGEVSLELAAFERVRSEFGLPREQAVILRLPETGSVDLRLVGYPDGVIPQLIDVEGRGEEQAVPLPVTEAGLFRFEDLVVGQQYRVFFYVEYFDPDWRSGRLFHGTHLPEQSIDGPEVHGGVTERSLRHERTPGFYGRFILPEHRRRAVQFSSGRDFVAKGLADRLSQPVELIGLSVYPDGSFYVSPTSGYALEDKRSLTDFHSLAFEWWVHGVNPRNPGGADERRTLFASIPVAQEHDEQVVELGEVYLEEEPTLLHIKVRDTAGDPVPGASLSLLAVTDGSIDGEPSHSGQSSLWTDEQGEIWVQDASWYTEFGLLPPDSKYSHFGKINEITVKLSHSDFAPAEARIQLDRRELELTMQGAGSAEGSFIPCDGLNMVWISWLPVGAPLTHDNAGEVSLSLFTDANHFATAKLEEFNRGSIPEGLWDVVFSVGGNLTHEVFRVPSVEIKGGERTRDPRLQNVDLCQFVTIYRVEFRTAEGAPVTPPKIRGRLKMRLGPNHFADHQLRWSNGGLGFAEPLGVPLDGFIRDENWLNIDLRTLRAGENRVTVYPRRAQNVQAQLAAPLHESVAWTVYLASVEQPRDTPEASLDSTGLGKLTLSKAGQYELTWQAQVRGEFVTSEAVTRDFPLAELTGDSPIILVPPAAFLEQVRALSGG